MKKNIALIILTFAVANVHSQNSEPQQLVFNVDSAKYEVGTTKLLLKISVQNNSAKDIYILRPEPFLINGHYSEKDETGKHGLLNAPYKINIEGDKMCEAEYPSDLAAMEDGKQSKLLKYLGTIPAGEKLQFDEIRINYNNGGFCKRSAYRVNISYKQDLYIYDEYDAKEIMDLYQEIIKKSKWLDRALGIDAKEFHSIKQANYENFKNFIEKTLPEIKKINGVEFKSTTTSAIVIE